MRLLMVLLADDNNNHGLNFSKFSYKSYEVCTKFEFRGKVLA